jgi:hypothetical protein
MKGVVPIRSPVKRQASSRSSRRFQMVLGSAVAAIHSSECDEHVITDDNKTFGDRDEARTEDDEGHPITWYPPEQWETAVRKCCGCGG